jgi:hypothetical protein
MYLALLLGIAACEDAPTLGPDVTASFAKSGTQRVDFTITDVGTSLVSDGKGVYADGVCGVTGSWASDVTHLAPAEAKIPRSQQAACAGIAPRAATLTLAVRHLSDVPHLDDNGSPVGSGSFSVSNVKFGWGSANATTVNAGNCGTVGLRFTSTTYPGTDNLVREDLGGGSWHMYTLPWPNNRAYCQINGAGTYWHVPMDVYVQIK